MKNLKIVALLGLVVSTIFLIGCSKEIALETNVNDEKLALEGYDPVSYFSGKEPIKGKPEFKAVWEKATYHFSSEENRDSFKTNSEKYAPQYGGYCSYAMSLDALSPVDPKVYKVVKDKLYLQHNEKAQKLWMPDHEGNIKKADGYWVKYPKKSL